MLSLKQILKYILKKHIAFLRVLTENSQPEQSKQCLLKHTLTIFKP